jgi:hypothetical protein
MNEIMVPDKAALLADLAFDKAISVSPVLEKLREFALFRLNQSIARSLPDGASVVVHSLDFAFKRKRILVELSKNGQALLDSGKAVLSIDEWGRILPNLRDAKTGQIIEQFRGANFPIASKLASLSAVIVGAAHIISGADISKKLDRLQDNASFLVATRKIDQIAKLRSIYEELRESLQHDLSDHLNSRIKSIIRELSCLRYTWLGEIEYHLNQLNFEDSYDSRVWLKKLFTSQQSVDTKIENKIVPLSVELQLVDFTLSLELLAYQYCDGSNHFLSTVRMPDEIKLLQRVRNLIAEKSKLLKKSESIQVFHVIRSFDDVIRKNECFVSGYTEKPEIDVTEAKSIAYTHKVGRNDLCPCGSFLKFKQCCGR